MSTEGSSHQVTRYQLYSRYERVWHWLQAAAILVLLASGMSIHAPTWFPWFRFETAVSLHNVLGFLLIGNALLGLFYYLITGAIRQYLPEPREFVSLSFKQARYYVYGMFHGERHPLEKSPERRLNPLQQAAYLMILNVLLPLQIVTGLAMWSAQQWSGVVDGLGGLAGLAMIHGLGAWLFGAFAVMHIYLTTTGSTPWANLKAMIVGYEEVRPRRRLRWSASEHSRPGPATEGDQGAVS